MVNEEFLSRAQVRKVDEIAIHQYGIPGIVLMENASLGAVAALEGVLPTDARILILCGKGNNGGDGYAMARHFAIAGNSVQIISICPAEQLTGDAATNRHIVERMSLPILDATTVAETRKLYEEASVIVDCLLGTGAVGSPQGLAGELIKEANAKSAIKVAVDIPSGLDCDTGELMQPVFEANTTLTFVAKKVGFANAPENVLGRVKVIGIGAPRQICEAVKR